MKSIITVFLLVSAAAAQTTQPVQTESLAPSLTVSIADQQQRFYRFRITNTSSHAVTAFALSTVPSGIEKGQEGFICDNRCSGSFALGDAAQPAIKAGASAARQFATSSVNGSTLVLNAAIFDDESYEGEETAAAQLVARQIGRQAEFDRIVSAINLVFTAHGNNSDAGKTALIRMRLSRLPTRLDAKMVRTFKLWFPELAGCAQQYARLMKSAAASEKKQVVKDLEKFAHGNLPGNPSLSQWWQTTQEVLASAGCSGCGNQAMHPKRHSHEQNVSANCQARPQVVFTASLADDGTDSGTEEEAAEVDLGPEDVAALDESASMPTNDSEPVEESAEAETVEPETVEAEAATVEPATAMPVSGETRLNMPPTGIPFIPAPDGRGQLLWRATLGAATDDLVYRIFFRDIAALGDMALQEEVRWIDGQQVEHNGPQAGGLSKVEIVILKKAAGKCNEQANEIKAKSDDLLKSSVSGYPVGWLIYAPPVPGIRELKDQETASIHKCIVRLRGNLGSSFVHLQGFLKKVYGTSQEGIGPVRLSDDALYSNYLRYLSMLDKLAAANPQAKNEAALRQQELTGAGLEEHDRALLTKTALEYYEAMAALYVVPQDEMNQPSGGVSALGALQRTEGQTATMPSPTMAAVHIPPDAILPAVGMPGLAQPAGMPAPALTAVQIEAAVMPLATVPESQDGKSKELRRKADEAQLSLLTGIAQLQAGMSAPVYKKFDAYLHKLYADAMIPKAANFMGLAAGMPAGKSEQQ